MGVLLSLYLKEFEKGGTLKVAGVSLSAAGGSIAASRDIEGERFMVGTHDKLSEPTQLDEGCVLNLITRSCGLPNERVNEESGGHGTEKFASAEWNALKSS